MAKLSAAEDAKPRMITNLATMRPCGAEIFFQRVMLNLTDC